MKESSPQEIEQVKKELAHAENIVVFTGAGLSTGSGIPDFRGPQGVWKTRRPVVLQEFLSSHEARMEYWDYKQEGYQAFKAARPNEAHRALAQLEEDGRLRGLVTQNVDGLHSLAGTSEDKLIELHGTNRKVRCLDCGDETEPEEVFRQFEASKSPPICSHCGGWLKPATISFGQQLVEEDLKAAFRWARDCDFMVSLGSTLSVQPAASIPLAAVDNAAPYLVVNRGQTEHDELARYRLEGDLLEIVPALFS
jgi:NAD-dependent deacetylase